MSVCPRLRAAGEAEDRQHSSPNTAAAGELSSSAEPSTNPPATTLQATARVGQLGGLRSSASSNILAHVSSAARCAAARCAAAPGVGDGSSSASAAARELDTLVESSRGETRSKPPMMSFLCADWARARKNACCRWRSHSMPLRRADACSRGGAQQTLPPGSRPRSGPSISSKRRCHPHRLPRHPPRHPARSLPRRWQPGG